MKDLHIPNQNLEWPSRRQWFHGMGVGLGTVALNAMLQADERNIIPSSLTPREPHHPPRATACIMIFLEGGPSHIDTFDPKPELEKRDGEKFSREGKFVSAMAGGERYFVRSPFTFHQAGESGLWFCERFSRMSTIADELCIYRGLQVESINHPEACLHFHTGSRFGGEPAIGAWSTYGLGTENQNLPAFVVLPETAPQGGSANWSSGYLPAQYQGTPLRSGETPILDIKPRVGVTTEHQLQSLELMKRLDQDFHRDHPLQDRLDARMANYELAFRMQATVPELADLHDEPQHIHEMYGIGGKVTDDAGRKCLLARKLVESGVRFVQIISTGWDAHDNIVQNHGEGIGKVDQPMAGLIGDLKQRGLLDTTLVIICGEFGRSPDNGKRAGKIVVGRDHNPHAMSIVMAGGGVKRGTYVGATDEIGEKAVECVHPLRDFHVTLLHLLGLDDNKLTYFHSGRYKQLSQIGGQLISDIIA